MSPFYIFDYNNNIALHSSRWFPIPRHTRWMKHTLNVKKEWMKWKFKINCVNSLNEFLFCEKVSFPSSLCIFFSFHFIVLPSFLEETDKKEEYFQTKFILFSTALFVVISDISNRVNLTISLVIILKFVVTIYDQQGVIQIINL